MPQADKISKFLEAIHKEAEIRRERITSETEAFKQAEMKKAETEALDEAYKLIQHEIAEARAKTAREVAEVELAAKKKLLEHRDDITRTVFDKAALRLEAYTQTAEYKKKMAEYAAGAAELLGGAVTVMLRRADKALESVVLSACPEGSDVEITDSFFIGGLIARSKNGGTVADRTYDTALENQRQSFYADSGLKLTSAE